MKRILCISIALILLSFSIVSNAIITNSSEYSNVKVYVFYEDNNEKCEQEKQWINDNTNIREEYIKVSENGELFEKVKKALNIKKDELPIAIIGSAYFVGFDEKVQNSMKEAIAAYDGADEYGDLVEKLKKDENVDELIKQNEEIYKQPKNSNNLVKIILIVLVIVIIIIIAGRLYVQNKKKKKRPTRRTHTKH